MAQRGPRLNDLDEPEYRQNTKRSAFSDLPTKLRRNLLPVAVGGAAILFVLIMLVLVGGSGDSQKATKEGEGVDNLEARLNKLEFQHQMVLEKMNKIQESSSSGVGQQELAKLRKAVSDLEARLAGLESRLAEQLEAGTGTEAEAGGGSSEDAQRHTVQQGETLFSIGQRYGVSVEKLRKWNDIGTNEFIHPGQELKVAQ